MRVYIRIRRFASLDVSDEKGVLPGLRLSLIGGGFRRSASARPYACV